MRALSARAKINGLSAMATTNDGFHEIQLNGKQLVFLFMAVTVVSVVIFLMGVLVGRGVRASQAPPGDPPIAADQPSGSEQAPAAPPADDVPPTPDEAPAPAAASDGRPDVMSELTQADGRPPGLTPPAWPAHPAWMAQFLTVLGTRITT